MRIHRLDVEQLDDAFIALGKVLYDPRPGHAKSAREIRPAVDKVTTGGCR
jgi:hypothetical protein